MQGSSVDHYVSGQTSPWLAIIAEAEFGQFVSLLFPLCIWIYFFLVFQVLLVLGSYSNDLVWGDP